MKICKQMILSKFGSKQGMDQDDTAFFCFFIVLYSKSTQTITIDKQQLGLKTRLTNNSYRPTIGFQVKITNWPMVNYFAMIFTMYLYVSMQIFYTGNATCLLLDEQARREISFYLGITNKVFCTHVFSRKISVEF